MVRKNLIKCFAITLCLCLGFVMQAQETKETSAGVYNEALELLKSKDYAKGLELMEKALELAKEDENEQVLNLSMKNGSFAAYKLGDEKLESKANDEAIALFRKSIELDSTNSAGVLGLAKAYEAKEDNAQSVEFYVKSAKMYMEEDKDAQAQNILKKAEVMVGKTYVAKDYDSAISMGKAFLKNHAKNAEVNYYLSRSLAEKGELDTAIDHMNKALEIEEDDKYYFYLGDILAKAGKNAEAKAAYGKVTEEKYKAQAEYRAGQL